MTPVEGEQRLDAIVSVHLEAFPGFFMSQLGPRFLRGYYRCVEEYPLGLLLTEFSEHECLGFVAGFVDPAAFYRELRRRKVGLALAAAAGVAARPRRLLAMLANYRRASTAANRPREARTAELASLAVRPLAAGHGIGARLVHRFIEAAAGCGADRVLLTTDAHGNDAVNRFYSRLGFTCTRTFEARRGLVLNEYQLETGGRAPCDLRS